MPQVRALFEKDIREISRLAEQVESLLRSSDSAPSPVRYQQVIRRVSELHQKWADHQCCQSRLSPLILSNDPRFAPMIHRLEDDGATLEQQLKAIRYSSWPRSAEAGIFSIRINVSATLKLLYRQMEQERTVCLPLLPRWSHSPAEKSPIVPSVGIRLIEATLQPVTFGTHLATQAR